MSPRLPQDSVGRVWSQVGSPRHSVRHEPRAASPLGCTASGERRPSGNSGFRRSLRSSKGARFLRQGGHPPRESRESDGEARHNRCAGRPWPRQAVGVCVFLWPHHYAQHTPGPDTRARLFVRFAIAGVGAFAGWRVRDGVDCAFVGAAWAPMSGRGFRRSKGKRYLSVRLRIAVVRALHVA